MREATGELFDSRDNYGKSIQECLDQNPYATTRTFTAFNRDIAEVIAKDGKSICVFNRAHDLPTRIEDINLNPMGDVTNASLMQGADGRYTLDWQDINGAHRRDVYDRLGTNTFLDQSDITLSTATGGTARGIYYLNPNGSEHNAQLIQTSAAGQVSASLTGSDIVTSIDHAEINLEANSSATVFGAGNSFTASGSGVWANLAGDATQANFTQSGNVVGFTGTHQVYTGAGNTVWLNNGADGVIEGSNNRVVMNGAGNYAEIYGANTGVEAYGTGQRIGLTGSNQRVTASASDVWLHGASDSLISGNNNAVVLNGSGAYAEIVGANTHVSAFGTSERIGLTGDNQLVTASASDVWFHPGSDGTLTGSNNTLVANGKDIQAFVNGADTRVVSSFSGNTFTLSGDRQMVSATGDQVWFASGTDRSISGNNNTVVANGGDVQLLINGNNTNLISNAAGNTLTLTGLQQTISASNDAVWFNPDSDYSMRGNGNTVVYNGNRINGKVTGDNTVAFLKGNTNTIFLTGHHLTITADYDVITLGPNSDAVIYGHGNTFYTDNSSRATFPNEPNRNMNDPSGKSAAELAALARAIPQAGHFSTPVPINSLTFFSNIDAPLVGSRLELGDDPFFW